MLPKLKVILSLSRWPCVIHVERKSSTRKQIKLPGEGQVHTYTYTHMHTYIPHMTHIYMHAKKQAYTKCITIKIVVMQAGHEPLLVVYTRSPSGPFCFTVILGS